jgi:hypothetical protein
MSLLGRKPELKEPALRGHRGVDEHGVAEATVLHHRDATEPVALSILPSWRTRAAVRDHGAIELQDASACGTTSW